MEQSESAAGAEFETGAAGPIAEEAGATASRDADWRAGIEDEGLRRFAERFKSPADLAKTAHEFRQKLSRALVVPGKDAPDEEVAAFHSRLGVPDGPDGYDYQLPEAHREALAEQVDGDHGDFFQAMHQAGASRAAVSAALDFYYDRVAEHQAAEVRSLDEGRAAAEAELRGEWGEASERNKALSIRAVREFGGEDLAQLLDQHSAGGLRLGDHPVLIKAFAAIGRRLGEDGLNLGSGGPGAPGTEERLDDLTRRAHDARARGRVGESNRLFAERERLSLQAFGE